MDKELLLLIKIQNMVEQHLFPTCYDTADIATKIYIELLEKNRFLSRMYVRNRCIDELRKCGRMKFCPIESFEHLEAPKESSFDVIELINVLMKQSMFSAEEKQLIYKAFYKDEKVSSDALDKIMFKLRTEMGLLLNKEG